MRKLRKETLSALPKVTELTSDRGGIIPRQPVKELVLSTLNFATSSCISLPTLLWHVCSFCSGLCVTYCWDHYFKGCAQGVIQDRCWFTSVCPVLVLSYACLCCVAHFPTKPFWEWGLLFSMPLIGKRSWKTLLLFLSFGNSCFLLLPCHSTVNPWDGCLCSFISAFYVAVTTGWFYTVCWEEGKNCLTPVLGKIYFCLGNQHENDFVETQHYGSSFYILPLNISQATVIWIIIVESPHRQYSVGCIDSLFFSTLKKVCYFCL